MNDLVLNTNLVEIPEYPQEKKIYINYNGVLTRLSTRKSFFEKLKLDNCAKYFKIKLYKLITKKYVKLSKKYRVGKYWFFYDEPKKQICEKQVYEEIKCDLNKLKNYQLNLDFDLCKITPMFNNVNFYELVEIYLDDITFNIVDVRKKMDVKIKNIGMPFDVRDLQLIDKRFNKFIKIHDDIISDDCLVEVKESILSFIYHLGSNLDNIIMKSKYLENYVLHNKLTDRIDIEFFKSDKIEEIKSSQINYLMILLEHKFKSENAKVDYEYEKDKYIHNLLNISESDLLNQINENQHFKLCSEEKIKKIGG